MCERKFMANIHLSLSVKLLLPVFEFSEVGGRD